MQIPTEQAVSQKKPAKDPSVLAFKKERTPGNAKTLISLVTDDDYKQVSGLSMTLFNEAKKILQIKSKVDAAIKNFNSKKCCNTAQKVKNLIDRSPLTNIELGVPTNLYLEIQKYTLKKMSQRRVAIA